MIRIALIAVFLFGCKIQNELSCDNPDLANATHCSTIDAPTSCADTGTCPDGLVCKEDGQVCVECVVDTDCPAEMPVCNADNTCEVCTAHDQCASELCNLPTGECIDETAISYVEENGTGVECTKAEPCPTMIEGLGALGAGSGRAFMKVTGSVIDTEIADTNGRDFTLFGAPGAKLSRSTAGTILSVNSDSKVTIFDLEVTGGQGGGSIGIALNDSGSSLTLERVLLRGHIGGKALDANDGEKLTMRRCIVSGNNAGGVEAEGVVVEMTNNLIVRNGNTSTNSGGVQLDPEAGSIFEFNTIANNASLNATNSGVNCVNPFAASSNIVTDNGLDASCTFTFSLFTTIVPPGTGNRAGNPMFANDNPADPTVATYYRIQTGSMAIDMADPDATQTIDIDGQMRGAMRDMGADELAP